MAKVRTVDFLPEIFQTDANKQFLAATLDQLVQEPRFKNTQGFIGRTVGPGVNPNDRYVIEPNQVRQDYQLEPGVVSLEPDTNNVVDVMTYTGMNDAVGFAGGNGLRPDRLYQSSYYTWDPFLDFDSFVNFSQYFWLPSGPNSVNVTAEQIPTTANFVVTRENGVYTFSGVTGNNPQIELVRGGSYTFQVAQNNKETVNYRVKNNGTSAYVIDNQTNPALTLARGNTYVFNLALNGEFPFWIKTAAVTGTANAYDNGVSRNGAVTGLVTFTVPQDAPDTLYYISQNQSNLQGVLNIIDGTPGTGPGFWIQAQPGISGTLPATPNISSREVFGVNNNGEDLGTVVFNVPYKDAQAFYYNLSNFGAVDLLSTLKFDQVNNQPVDWFLTTYGGIDGFTDLNNRTVIFTESSLDAEDGGWLKTTLFDPLTENSANNGLIGSFDTTTFSQTTEIPFNERYQVYQISYVNSAGTVYIQLNRVQNIDTLQKFTVRSGTVYSSTQWYKAVTGEFLEVPLLTAAQDVVYYQDGTDPDIFGQIKLVEQTDSSTIFVDDIIGKSTYTSPNGIKFTNGLKVRFTGDVEPARYRSGNTTITYTQTEANTNFITAIGFVDDLYVGQQIIFTDPTIGGLLEGQTYYIRGIAAGGLKFTVSEELNGEVTQLMDGTGTAYAIAIANREYYISGVGVSIELLPVQNFVVPESYANDHNTATIAVEPEDLDYLTIDRASRDLNPWTRSNRWFHIDVINATAAYNDTVAVLDNNYRAKRPIIQFRPGIRLWNMGTEGKAPVDIIDFEETDAFSNIEGSTSYSVDGYDFVEGTRVIFAADNDINIRNKIYVVSFVSPESGDTTTVINLTPAGDSEVLVDQNTVVLYGNTISGQTYWYNGEDWILAQQKTKIQQAPLYNVYDSTGVSFGDTAKYQSSNFVGSKLFSYAVADTTILDPILQFPLQYLNINNVGDIVFENNLYKDTFVYVVDNASVTLDISSGSVRQFNSRVDFDLLIGWQNAVTDSQIYQQFKFLYKGTNLKLDVAVNNQVNSLVPVIKIYVGAVFQDPSTYTYTTTENTTEITLSKVYAIDDVIEVLVLSDQDSPTAFYQVPINLESNPLNANSTAFTLGTIRTHYQSICENLNNLDGAINGANNTRDLGNIVPYGLVILQQSAPLTLAGYFLRSKDYNIFSALRYNSQEYIKYKALVLDAVLKQNVGFNTIAQVLDTAIQDITLGKLDAQPFYWSDMLPTGVTSYSNTYTVNFTTSGVFDTVQTYNYRQANYQGLLVYVNNEILTRGIDYVVATDGPRIEILTALSTGDVVLINEYVSTYGSFVPNTPTKLGLYPSWQPAIVTQQTSNGPRTFILGHDGSVTPTFGDLRDRVLLEFETRIFNNLKLDDNPIPLTVYDVLPGQFRDTGFTFEEINSIFAEDFLSYCGWNKLDFRTQIYNSANSFTYNYSNAQNRLNNSALLGAWRGIYRYTYDTQQPEYTPWEMLGFSIQPSWWEDRYGPAPYTSDNLVLWDDLEDGYVADPDGAYYLTEFARPGLTSVLPTDSEGNLLSPLNSVVGSFNENQFQQSWAVGDGGPVEASWWNSSAYPFAVMRLLALTRPAKFFALFADRDLYRYNEEFNQYLYNDRYRLDANGIEIYGDGVSKASYINWIVDYNRTTGLNSTELLTADLQNLDVRLCYRMASFSDKKYIKLYTEKSSPNSTNTALLIPDESYNLLVYKNQPFERIVYSSVIIQRTESGGYSVFGYSQLQPYFNTYESRSGGQLKAFNVADTTVKVPNLYSDNIKQIAYGTVFFSLSSVCDFLLSYGKYLESQGLVFDNVVNGYILDWNRMCQEFIYWTQQGWDTQAILNLNPLAAGLSVTKEFAIVDSLRTQTLDNSLLDQNSQELVTRNLNIVRLGNNFSVRPLTTQSLSFADLNFTTYEHLIVLNNQSVFGDLIYDPITGARQSRLNLVAITSTDWNGSVNAPGFILNQDNVKEWDGTRIYSKGEIVKYKNVYWSAQTIVQPSESFNFNNWVQSDYTQIELGLLPNIANKANQLINSYNINSANIESDNDLLSYGLIGFRPRQYMAALNLDDVSQLNIYRQFLGTKGTVLSTELFKGANFSKETADYNIYENWAVQRAVYGANANRSFVELRLNRGLLDSNPSVVQITLPQQQSEADQVILLSDVWRESYKLTSTAVFPTTTELPTDIGLPTAGYVSLDDVDITVFDITNNSSLNANIDKIKVGTNIWVAKINDYDWNIYRAEPVPGTIQHICDNLDGTSRVIFSDQHGLAAGDTLIIKEFDFEVDGVYSVLSVGNLTTVNIAFQFSGDRTVADGTGLGFTLQSQRVSQASDVVDLPYANNLTPGVKVWIDNNSEGLWTVLEKQQTFTELLVLAPDETVSYQNEQYGTSVAQAPTRFATLIGAPGYSPTGASSNVPGGVYVYVKNYSAATYQPISPVSTGPAVLTLGVDGVRGYGNSVDFGNIDWAAAGASASLDINDSPNSGYVCVLYKSLQPLNPYGNIPYLQWQLLTDPKHDSVTGSSGEFGYTVAMSDNARWMYVGAPNGGTYSEGEIYAFGKIDYTLQQISGLGDGSTTEFNIGDVIRIDADTQLTVTLNGTVLRLDIDYTVAVDFSSVTFTEPPAINDVWYIIRSEEKQLDYGLYYGVAAGATSGSGTGAVFTIERVRGEIGQPGSSAGYVVVSTGGEDYAVLDTVTLTAVTFGGGNNATLTVTEVDDSGAIVDFTIAYTAPTLTDEFDLSEVFFRCSQAETTIWDFSIIVNGDLQRPNIDYTYLAGTVTFESTSVPAAGAVIEAICGGTWKYCEEDITPDSPAIERFGESIATCLNGRLLVVGGNKREINGLTEAGAAYVWLRSYENFIIEVEEEDPIITVGGDLKGPVAVLVNDQFWTEVVNSAPGQANTFEVVGSTVQLYGTLLVGDIVTVETNNFRLVQTLTAQTPGEFSNFGSACSMSSDGTAIFVGEPQSSVQTYKGGMVTRFENQSMIYGTITSGAANPALTAGAELLVNGFTAVVPSSPNNTVTGLANYINSNIPNVTASVSTTGYLTISVANFNAAPINNKLCVLPGRVSGAALWAELDFELYAWTQNIASPYPIPFAGFGASLDVDPSGETLVVGAPQGSMYLEIEFDDGTMIIDDNATTIFELYTQSGAVYTFDFLPSTDASITNPGKFVFGVQLETNELNEFDKFGSSVSYIDGIALSGAPAGDLGDSSASDYGSVFVFENPGNRAAWQVVAVEEPVVDIRLLNSVFLYDRVTSATTEFLDFINPLQGKILGAARQNIDYIGAVDPASYTAGNFNIRGTTWAGDHVGEVWWDTSTARFIDPNQDSLVYASRRWSQLFPGSAVQIYQWVKSSTPPASYAGPGTPRNILSYTVNSSLTLDGTIVTEYYFWVSGLTTVASGKTLPISTVASYITDPKASGIPYIAPIDSSTIALYNAGDYIEAQDTILHIEFDRELTSNNVHVEYELIPQDRADGFLSTQLYRKFLDSFCGVDSFGNLVPDLSLSVAERYGVQFRPRQSMFVNRFEALRNYLQRANSILSLYPITENRTFTLLNSAESIPSSSSGLWNFEVANLEILSYQDIYAVTLNYRYLVLSDSNNRGLWSIYQVQQDQTDPTNRILVLYRVQTYNTPDYWSYVNWYRPGYNPSTQIIAEVATFNNLGTLDVPVGSSVKVTANAQGKFEIYLLEDTGWNRVGLEDGTISFSAELWDYSIGRFGWDIEVFDAQYFDQEPVIETRKIIEAINQELFVDDLAIERNRALVLMFNFVLSEFSAPEWLVKTSLIDVDHRIRDLVPYQNYIRDNQEFVEDYIQEVKPYHVQVREFNLRYDGEDTFVGDITDFDLPAYFNTSLEIPKFTSPVLTPYTDSSAFNSTLTLESNVGPTDQLWQSWPYSQWYGNFLLNISSITVTDGGTGYNAPPEVTIVGDAVQAAEAIAVIDSNGQVVEIQITLDGIGYRSTPTVEIVGGNGTGARAYAVMYDDLSGRAAQAYGQNYSSTPVPLTVQDYSLARTFRTIIRYDRFQFQPSVSIWNSEATYQTGDLVRYDNQVYEASSSDSTEVVGPTFDLANWTLVNPATYMYPGSGAATGLSGVDRTFGLYVAGVNQPGLDLPLLINGLDYPGVQVYGLGFNGDPAILDAVYESEFTDDTLGVGVSAINVEGGEFVGPYEGHAPEELVNGSEFDSVDIKVFTRPGSDWDRDGHGFQIKSVRYSYNPAIQLVYSFADVVENPVTITVSNVTTGFDLVEDVDYTVNWANLSLSIIGTATSSGDTVNITVYEIGGGSQLYRTSYPGNASSTLVVPVNSSEIYQIAFFINGTNVPGSTWVPYIDSVNWAIGGTYLQNTVVNSSSVYYRAIQDVPIGVAITNTNYWLSFVPTLESRITLPSTPTINDLASVVVMGIETTTQHDWSTAQIEYFVADEEIVSSKVITPGNSLQGTNPANLIITRNGVRLQPPEGIEWIGDGSTLEFDLPVRGQYDQIIVNPATQVQVWVDNELQVQTFGPIVGDYYVTPYISSAIPLQVVFFTPPDVDSRILISVSTVADYLISNGEIDLSPIIVNINDVFAVTTWNDTSQQNALTLVFVGPVLEGISINQPYDSTPFDAATVSGTPGSFDYTVGIQRPVNNFLLERANVDASRLWVTLDGFRLFEGEDYIVQDGEIILPSGAIASNQVLAVTEFTNSVVPESIALRIFQDMRGVQATYRITADTSTTVRTAVAASDNIIYVNNAANLTQPNLESGIFGLITIGGERIQYRERNLANNSISGLRRGTAGTAASSHEVDTPVYDIGRGNLLLAEYQDYIVSDTTLGDGSTSIFYAPNIDLDNSAQDSSSDMQALEVYVGGIRQYPYSFVDGNSQYRWFITDFDPVAVEFVVDYDVTPPLTAPDSGSEVTILVRRAKSWYEPGDGTASNGVALQDTDTPAARFLRGE